MPRALAIVHQADAGPGVFKDEALARGWDLTEWPIATQAQPAADPGGYDAVFAFGGGMHADHEAEHPWLATEKELLARLLEAGVPTLGVCLGSQLLAEAAGARAERAPDPEIGWLGVQVADDAEGDPVIGALAPRFEAFQWHSYRSPLPPGATALATSPIALQAYRIGDSAWGIQFHAEVSEVDAVSWAVNFAVDEDAVRIGVDPDALSAQILARIGEWNKLGRALCGRFLQRASELSSIGR